MRARGFLGMLALTASVVVGGALLTGCGQTYVRGTEIKYTAKKQDLADVVERYRVAVEQRDAKTLTTLASRDYHENGSTTTDPSDDYDYHGLNTVLSNIESSIKAVQYEIDITAIEIYDETATVDYEYRSQYLFTSSEADRWATASDKNRLTFIFDNGKWLIISGM